MRSRLLFASLTFGLGLVLLSLWTLGASATASADGFALADLPPRPTAVPTSTPLPSPTPSSPPEPEGATLALHAAFPEGWDFGVVDWRAPWTAVQWQDAVGDWHTVEGWQGSFDHVLPEGDRYFGLKTWWVAPRDLGTGTFRWVVYAERGGAPLVTSDPFTLPGVARTQHVVVVVMTMP